MTVYFVKNVFCSYKLQLLHNLLHKAKNSHCLTVDAENPNTKSTSFKAHEILCISISLL